MIDPNRITNYNLNNRQLEEHLIFWVLVAGKTASVISTRMHTLFRTLARVFYDNPNYQNISLFSLLRRADKAAEYLGNSEWLSNALKANGIGCYGQKSNTLLQLASSNLNLNNCTARDLEVIKGIGPKTARCFILHSRDTDEYAGLDTHILKFMRDIGYDVPKSTPQGKRYRKIEKQFLDLAKRAKRKVAKFDLTIWRIYANKPHLKNRFVKTIKELNHG